MKPARKTAALRCTVMHAIKVCMKPVEVMVSAVKAAALDADSKEDEEEKAITADRFLKATSTPSLMYKKERKKTPVLIT